MLWELGVGMGVALLNIWGGGVGVGGSGGRHCSGNKNHVQLFECS